MNNRYLDPAPLLRAAELRLLEHGHVATEREIAEFLGVNLKQVHRWHHGGRIFWPTADRCANALGLHPYNLWPDGWTMVETAEEGRKRRGRDRARAKRAIAR